MIDSSHSFSPAIAEELTVYKALLLKEIGGWCSHNQKNGKNIDENGIAWVFMSVGAKDSDNSPKNCFSKKFPYMKERSIHRWLTELEEDGWIYSKTDNRVNYDRTKSYRINIEKYNQTIIDFSIRQNGESNCQNGESIRQNGEPIHSLNNTLNNKEDIKSKKFLSSIETRAHLSTYLQDDKNIENLNAAIMKNFSSLEDARFFYNSVADEFCEKGFKRYKYTFLDINYALPFFQTWCRNKKHDKRIAPKHRLFTEFTKEEFDAAKDQLVKETNSPIMKTRIVEADFGKLLRSSKKMLEKIKSSKEFSKCEPLEMHHLLRIFLRYEHRQRKLKEVFKDLSYAHQFKSVWNFIKKRKEFVE